ncbi:hypothetical protein [Lyngbya sp. CCY1209]|jgi:hypothetical protein|uniref:hypothetical protein n=1 Tax=Lyngbya sp. CCY1209 TaxID=2886103 RepID=UPI002D200618|nr:hypothetical protein [Lyngbya sp. CCY1209]MEB3883634.1 hypothetical protein [Lyngbya sp. CCY1209]
MKFNPFILFTFLGLVGFTFDPPIASAGVGAIVEDKRALDEPGLYLATATLEYDDGDVLTADFRIYCPTVMIRPTNYVLADRDGNIKRQGDWWEPAFKAEYSPETMLVEEVCGP